MSCRVVGEVTSGRRPTGVADISMTGVGVVAARYDALRVGAVLSLEIRGASGEALIRKISAVADPTSAHYRLEYCQLASDFHDVVGDLVADTHKDFDWQWTNRAVAPE